MQWSDRKNAGFSTADTSELIRPAVTEGPLGSGERNVAAQAGDSDALMGRVGEMIRTRRSCPEIGWGDWSVLGDMPEAVLGLRFDWSGNAVLTLHNLSGSGQKVSLPEGDWCQLIGSDSETDRLPPFGFRWLRLGERR